MVTRNTRFKTKMKAMKMKLHPGMLSERKKEILALIANSPAGYSGPELASYFSVRNDTMGEHVGVLKIHGLVMRCGHGRNSRYCVKENQEACQAAVDKFKATSRAREKEAAKERRRLIRLGLIVKKKDEAPDEKIIQRVVSAAGTKINKTGPASVFELAQLA